MESKDQVQTLAAIDELSKYFFERSEAMLLRETDRDDVIMCVKALALTYPFDAERLTTSGLKAKRQTYIERLFTYGLRIWRAKSAISRERTVRIEEEDRQFLETITDPLSDSTSRVTNNGGVAIFDAAEEEIVMSPPCKVVFATTTTSPLFYRQDPLGLPEFKIEPFDEEVIALQLRETGQWRRVRRKDRLSRQAEEGLEIRRFTFEQCIKTLLPSYISDQGWLNLPQKYRNVISDINVHALSPSDIQRKRYLSRSTYYSHIEAIQHRGWLPTWHTEKNQEVYRYFPVYDGHRNQFWSRAMEAVAAVDIREMLSLAGGAFENAVYGHDLTENQLTKEMYRIRERLVEAKAGFEAEQDYDQRLRDFIRSLVERPCYTKNMTLKEINDITMGLPTKRLKLLLFTAVRFKQNIVDAMGLFDWFPEILAETQKLTLANLA